MQECLECQDCTKNWRGTHGDLMAHLCAFMATLHTNTSYPLRVHLQTGFKSANLTPDQEQFNKSMSDVRTSLEWIFGEIVKDWAFLDFKKNLQLCLSAVGKMYLVGTLLRNAVTCYGSQVCEFFYLAPSTLNEYFY